MTINKFLAKHYINFRGWKTNRKIVVIESDDWGSIRISSKEAFNSLKAQGYPVDKNKFTSLDSLETEEDLKVLFNILESFKDRSNNHPVVTACAVVANPDFEKIKDSSFQNYFFETVDRTYANYGEDDLLDFWKKNGIAKNLLIPQFHGREHLNPRKWLNILNSNNEMERKAFELNCLLGLSEGETKPKDSYLAAFEPISEEHKDEIKKITVEGLDIFEKIFGFKSISFMPSQSKQFYGLNETLVENGVSFNQGGQFFVPNKKLGFKKINKYWGECDQGITYWRRNCSFEPYKDQALNYVDSCLKEIEIAFRCGKPAVINSHRINYVSRLNKDHRDQSLEKLHNLLSSILKKWPEVEFFSSEDLGKLLKKEK